MYLSPGFIVSDCCAKMTRTERQRIDAVNFFRLIDRICSAAGLEHAQIERLCDEIPGFVALHIDNLEQVYTESKRLSPMHKVENLFHISPCYMFLSLIDCSSLNIFNRFVHWSG